jgi:uncharacterized membrane protein
MQIKKYSPLYIAVALLAIVWLSYFVQFHGSFSTEQGTWGTFGDFTGGVLNPLLNFVTIYLLITQYLQSREDAKKQKAIENIKSFESSFFTFTTIALNEYKSYELVRSDTLYKGAAAIGFIQKYVTDTANSGRSIYDAINALDEEQHDSIYSLASSFCVIFKLIEDSCPDEAKENYVNILSMLLPTKVTYLLCIAEACTKWKILKHPRGLGYFSKPSVAGVLEHFERMQPKASKAPNA